MGRCAGLAGARMLFAVGLFWSAATGSAFADPRCTAVAIGGTASLVNIGGDEYCLAGFDTAGSFTFTLLVPRVVEYLLVGGGGGGGAIAGGGGGGGGLRTGGVSLTPGPWTIVVGAGGLGDDRASWPDESVDGGGNGQPSSAFGIEAMGGGGGGTYNNGTTLWQGRDGGSGGGASHTATGGQGAPGQGFAGATGTIGCGNSSGGGGGGAGQPGFNGTAAIAGRGGDGLALSITGTTEFYAGGGAGGGDRRNNFCGDSGVPGVLTNVGGLGGGGASRNDVAAGNDGVNGRGGGGAGGNVRFFGDRSRGGDGGSGVVILRYVINYRPTANAGPDQSVAAFSGVILDASLSSDPDADPLTYSWTQVSGTTVALNGATSSILSFTAPQPANGVAETLIFRLTVTDPFGLTGTDEVSVSVTAIGGQPPPAGAGGTVNEYNDIPANRTWRAHVFLGSGTLELAAPTDVEYFIVAGGGGGGNSGTQSGDTLQTSAGGGGGGGLRQGTAHALGPGSFGVDVGIGGQGGTSLPNQAAQNGADSSFAGIIALGGGHGGGHNAGTPATGGSGGGGRGRNNAATTLGAAGTPGQGQAGGDGNGHGSNLANRTGGGGGGGGGSGIAGINGNAGAGGLGVNSGITGIAQSYAGGGGGGAISINANAGNATHGGGGGGGGLASAIPGDGHPGTGGGGGGAGFGRDAGGNGGSGVVILRYVINTGPTADAGPDQTVQVLSPVVLDGTGSTDPDDNIVAYAWTQALGPAVTLSDATAAQPGFTAPQPTGDPSGDTLVFELTVTDAFGLTSTDTVTITVQGVAILTASKAISVFSEDGSQCHDLTATPPAEPENPVAIPNACIEYGISVTNSGPSGAQDINLVDEIPASLTLRAAALGSGWEAGTLAFTPDCSGTGCEVLITGGAIPANTTATITIRATIN